MNLLDLQKHINNKVEENSKRWPERNKMPILVRLYRLTPKGRYKYRNFPMGNFWIGQYGAGGVGYGAVADAAEHEEIKP